MAHASATTLLAAAGAGVGGPLAQTHEMNEMNEISRIIKICGLPIANG